MLSNACGIPQHIEGEDRTFLPGERQLKPTKTADHLIALLSEMVSAAASLIVTNYIALCAICAHPRY
jgi:hypothetical protein